MLQSVVELQQRVHLHILAHVARTALGRRHRYELRTRAALAHLVQNSGLCRHDIHPVGMFLGILQHHRRRALNVGQRQHVGSALQVRHHNSLRPLGLQPAYRPGREAPVHMASALPQQHPPARNSVYIVAQVAVGTEDYLLVLRQLAYYALRIAARYDDVRQRLHRRRGVHIAHHRVAHMLLLELPQLLGAARVGKRAARVKVGTQHRLVRTQQLARLSHEVHAAHHYHLSLRLRRLASQRQRVAYEVGNVLHRAVRIIVRHNHGVLLLAHSAYLGSEVYPRRSRLVNEALAPPFVFHHKSLHF